MKHVIEFFRRLGLFIIGVPVGLALACLCLMVGSAFSILGTTLVMVFAAFIALLLVASPFATFINGVSLSSRLKDVADKLDEKVKKATKNNVEPFPNKGA